MDLDAAFLFALRDDGSLQVFAQEPPPPPGIAAADVQQKQLARAAANASAREAIAARLRGARGVGDDKIGNDKNDENDDESKGAAAAFPLDFFERTTCVTGEVTFGGDLARRTSSDSLRFALQSEDSHVEAPAPGACKVTMSLAKAGHVIVGLRVHLGNSGSTQTPTEMVIGPAPIPAPIPAPAPAPPPGVAPPRPPQSSNTTTTTTTTTDGRRKFPFEIGARRWYDVPLTRIESVAAERDLVVYLGAAASPGTCVRVDHIEVYSMPKSEFGWEAACVEAAQAAASAALVEAEAAAADGGLDPWEGEATAAGRSDRAARHAARYRGAADSSKSTANRDASGNARRAPIVSSSALSDEERVLCTSLGLLEKSARRADAAAAGAAARLSLRVLVPATLLEASSDTRVGHTGRTRSDDDVDVVDDVDVDVDVEDAGRSKGLTWIPSTTTRRLAWRVLRASVKSLPENLKSLPENLKSLPENPSENHDFSSSHSDDFDEVARAAEIKDEAVLAAATAAAASLASMNPTRGPGPADAAAFHAVARAAARCASRRPGAFAASRSARAATAALVAAHDAMIDAGAGAWDPEETAPALAHLVAATAHDLSSGEEGLGLGQEGLGSGEEGSAVRDGSPALRAASAMLLSGREDCRYAAANALADALIAPAASYPAADYARCLLPAAATESSSASSSRISSCQSVNRGSAAASAPRPAPPGTELTQFTCDRCDKSPVLGVRWHCTRCPDFDLCDECHRESKSGGGSGGALYPSLHSASHPMICYRVGPRRSPPGCADEAFDGFEGFGFRLGPPPAPPSEGKLRLAAALAATTDNALPGGAAELSPYFVLLRRLVAVPEYAAAVAPAVAAAAGDAAEKVAISISNPTSTSRREKEKFLLRLSLLSAVLAAKARAPAGSPAEDIEPPLASLARNLLVVAEALTASSSSYVEEPVIAVGGNGKTVSIRWGDPSASDRDASSSSFGSGTSRKRRMSRASRAAARSYARIRLSAPCVSLRNPGWTSTPSSSRAAWR